MTTIPFAAAFMVLRSVAVSSLVSEWHAREPLFDPFGIDTLVHQVGPVLFACAFLAYLPLTVIGVVAWRMRGKPRPPERLPGRERALPPPPRGPDA